jgi:hypothetical protein
MSVREKDDPALYARIQEQNLLRQYDLLSNCIEIGLTKGIEFFDKYTLWALNYAAVSNISQFGGRYREEPIYVGNHFPPHFREVPNQMDRFFSVVHENWAILDHPTVLPAYALWRLNWIHPFIESNGRTARAACYYLICLKQGRLLPGKKIVRNGLGKIGYPTMLLCKPQTKHGTKATSMFQRWRITLPACSKPNSPRPPEPTLRAVCFQADSLPNVSAGLRES